MSQQTSKSHITFLGQLINYMLCIQISLSTLNGTIN